MAWLIFDAKFQDTGWTPKCFNTSGPPVSQISISAIPYGDPWDRLGSVILNGVEVVRFITYYGEPVNITVNVPPELQLGWNKACGVLTTYMGYFDYKAGGTQPGSKYYAVIPAFTRDTNSQPGQGIQKTFPVPIPVEKIVLSLTGHGYEEGACGRIFHIYLNGQEVATLNRCWGWGAGCGCPVDPIILDASMNNVTSVAIKCDNCGSYWKVSMALDAPPTFTLPTQIPWWLLAAVGLAGIGAGVLLGYFVGKPT